MNIAAYYAAILSRDKRYDGQFYFAVRTTGIYCLPSCAAPRPLEKNVVYYATYSVAEQAGFRACKRCRPREWADAQHARGAAYDAAGFQNGIESAISSGLSERQIRRITHRQTGMSPSALKRARRLEAACFLLAHTQLRIIDVAFSADFLSLRQFNHTFKQAFGMTPRQMRAQRSADVSSYRPVVLRLKLHYKQPLSWQSLALGLRAHTIPYVEQYDDEARTFTRYWSARGAIVKVIIDLRDHGGFVAVVIETPDISVVDDVVARVRRLLDLDHDPMLADAALSMDPALSPLIAARPGLRIVGAWDPYELTILTIIGQQVSVASALTLAGRLVRAYGEPHVHGFLFPTMRTLAEADPQQMHMRTGIQLKKIATLQAFAALVVAGFDMHTPAHQQRALTRLRHIKGFGPWSVAYVALRGFGDPDAFPADDLIIKRWFSALHTDMASDRVMAMQPWRGYAAMHIWTEVTYS